MAIKVSTLLAKNTDVVLDTSPALGGPLDTNSFSIENGGSPVNITGNNYPITTGLPGQVLTTDGAGLLSWQSAGAGGAVTSFKLDDLSASPIFLTSPTVAATGAIAATITLDTQSANSVFAGPASGGAAQPTFRSLTTSDIPAVTNITGGTTGSIVYQSAPGTTTFLAPDTTGYVLTTNGPGNPPTWTQVVNSFSTGTTGFTPSTATSGAVTLGGTLNVANGGTGVSSIPLDSIIVGNGVSPVTSVSGVQYEVLTASAGGTPGFGAVQLAQSGVAVDGVLQLANGGTNAALSGSNGSVVYNNGTSLVNSAVGSPNQALLSSGAGAPTWQTVSSTITTDQILQGDGAGAFTAEGASFTGSGTYSGVTLLGTVTNATDATTKQYVDSVAQGLDVRTSVRLATTGDLATVTGNAWVYANGASGIGATLTQTGVNIATIDGVALVNGNRVLIKDQADETENGIYVVDGVAGVEVVLTRAIGDDEPAELNSAFVFVEIGTVNDNTGWTQTNDIVIIGTDEVVWNQFSGAGTFLAGAGLVLTGNTFDVDPDLVTVYINGSDKVAVLSSPTVGQSLLSTGLGNTASWGPVNLSNSSAVTGTLVPINGGTGVDTSTATDGQILIGNGTGLSLSTITQGPGIIVSNGPGTITISNSGMISFSAGTTGFTPSTAASGAVTLGGTLNVSNGGTGATTFAIDGVLYGNGIGAVSSTAAGLTGQVLVGNTGSSPAWTSLSTSAVTSFQTSLSGLTPNTSTTGAITLAGTLGISSGGTGQTTATLAFDALSPATTVGDIIYNNGTSNIRLPVGTAGQILTVVTGEPTWSNPPATGVTSFSAGTTGLTPSTPTTGAVVLGGILDVANGGTGIAALGSANTFLGVNAAGTASEYKVVSSGTGINVVHTAGAITINNTGVTSVGLSLPSFITVSGSPVTTTGALTGTLATQAANAIFAGPSSGPAAAPTFRALTLDDLGGALQLYSESATAPTAPSVTGTNSVAIGSGSTASADESFAVGDGADARIIGQKAYANGSFASAGDAQHGVYVLRNITTDDSYTELFINGVTATERLVLPNNSVFTFDILVVGRRTDATGGAAGYRFVGVAMKDATNGSITFVGNPSKTIIGETNGLWDAQISADTTNGSIKIETKAESTETVRWVATVQTSEVTN